MKATFSQSANKKSSQFNIMHRGLMIEGNTFNEKPLRNTNLVALQLKIASLVYILFMRKDMAGRNLWKFSSCEIVEIARNQ